MHVPNVETTKQSHIRVAAQHTSWDGKARAKAFHKMKYVDQHEAVLQEGTNVDISSSPSPTSLCSSSLARVCFVELCPPQLFETIKVRNIETKVYNYVLCGFQLSNSVLSAFVHEL